MQTQRVTSSQIVWRNTEKNHKGFGPRSLLANRAEKQFLINYSSLVLLVWVFCLSAGCSGGSGSHTSQPIPPEVRAFAERKEAQARDLAQKLNLELSGEFWTFFTAARAGDWPTATRTWEQMKKGARQYEGSRAKPGISNPAWQTVLETYIALEQHALGEPAYAGAFGRDIVQSIPAGSIYFGGTDPGRGLVTLYCRDHAEGDPFFVLSQNPLADGTYMQYLRAMYGDRMQIPSDKDSQRAFEEYLKDAQIRLKQKRLQPGEDVKIVDDRVQVSGRTAVMAINGILVRTIVEQNPERRIFIEESFPLDWMYPYLEPFGLIMELRRTPATNLAPAVLEKDQQFWERELSGKVGSWLKPDTSVAGLCEQADRIWVRKDLAGFDGDPKFVSNTNACQMYSKLRSAIAGVYAWHASQLEEPEARQAMTRAADYAYRQALALCPVSPEAVKNYSDLLVREQRRNEARQVVATALKVAPADPELKSLLRSLDSLP